MSKMDSHETRLSLVFKPVVDLCLADLMFVESIEFEEAVSENRKYLIHGYPVIYDSAGGTFVQRYDKADRERYVIASNHFLIEDQLDYSDTIPLFDNSVPK